MPTVAAVQERCDASGRAYAGSQRLIQFYVNEEPARLDQAIEHAFGRQFGLRWVSPLKNQHYREYKDLEYRSVNFLRSDRATSCHILTFSNESNANSSAGISN